MRPFASVLIVLWIAAACSSTGAPPENLDVSLTVINGDGESVVINESTEPITASLTISELADEAGVLLELVYSTSDESGLLVHYHGRAGNFIATRQPVNSVPDHGDPDVVWMWSNGWPSVGRSLELASTTTVAISGRWTGSEVGVAPDGVAVFFDEPVKDGTYWLYAIAEWVSIDRSRDAIDPFAPTRSALVGGAQVRISS